MCPQKGEKGGRLTTDQDTINGGSQEGGFGYPVSVLVGLCGGGLYCIGLRCGGLTNRQIVSKAIFPQTTGSTISYVWLQILQLNSGLKTYMFPRVFGDEFGDEFGDSPNLVINLVTNSVMNFVNH